MLFCFLQTYTMYRLALVICLALNYANVSCAPDVDKLTLLRDIKELLSKELVEEAFEKAESAVTDYTKRNEEIAKRGMSTL